MLTLAEFKAEMAKNGRPVKHLATQLPRIGIVERGNPDSPLVLVVTALALDGDDRPYVDGETGAAATEVHRFPIALLALEAPA